MENPIGQCANLLQIFRVNAVIAQAVDLLDRYRRVCCLRPLVKLGSTP